MLEARETAKRYFNSGEYFEVSVSDLRFTGADETENLLRDLISDFTHSGNPIPMQILGHQNKSGQVEWLIVLPAKVYISRRENYEYKYNFCRSTLRSKKFAWHSAPDQGNVFGTSRATEMEAFALDLRRNIKGFLPYVALATSNRGAFDPCCNDVIYGNIQEEDLVYQLMTYSPRSLSYEGVTFIHIS